MMIPTPRKQRYDPPTWLAILALPITLPVVGFFLLIYKMEKHIWRGKKLGEF